MLLVLNGGFDEVEWALPEMSGDGGWRVVVDTATDDQGLVTAPTFPVPGFSLVLLRYGQDRRTEQTGIMRAVETTAIGLGAPVILPQEPPPERAEPAAPPPAPPEPPDLPPDRTSPGPGGVPDLSPDAALEEAGV